MDVKEKEKTKMRKLRTTIIEELIDHDGKVMKETYKKVYEKEISAPNEVCANPDRYVKLMGCANYLIQFFYKTDKKYSCTRSKIGKLLSILAFKYAVKGIELFDEPIYRWSKCGTLIKGTNRVFSDVYVSYDMRPKQDAKKVIHPYEVNEEINVPNQYEKIYEIPCEVMKDIEDVFYNFGAYSQDDLSELLNPIVEYEGVCHGDIVDLEAIARLDKNQFPDNKVVEFIFKK